MSKGPSRATFAPSLSVPQLEMRSMGVLSLILKHVSSPIEYALSKRPGPIRDGFGDELPEEWLQDRDTSADETRVDLDDAPEKSLGRDPRTVGSCVAIPNPVGETDDGDDPVSWKVRESASWQLSHVGERLWGTGTEHTWSQS